MLWQMFTTEIFLQVGKRGLQRGLSESTSSTANSVICYCSPKPRSDWFVLLNTPSWYSEAKYSPSFVWRSGKWAEVNIPSCFSLLLERSIYFGDRCSRDFQWRDGVRSIAEVGAQCPTILSRHFRSTFRYVLWTPAFFWSRDNVPSWIGIWMDSLST